jgi:hypothetical protein
MVMFAGDGGQVSMTDQKGKVSKKRMDELKSTYISAEDVVRGSDEEARAMMAVHSAVDLLYAMMTSTDNCDKVFKESKDKCFGGDLEFWSMLKVNRPKPEINPKWRNNCSKLRNNHENSKLLQKTE